MPEQSINPNTEIDLALRDLKAQRERERYERSKTSSQKDTAALKEEKLREAGMAEQEIAQGRYGKLASPIAMGSGLSALLYTESGRKMMQEKLGMDPATVAAAKAKRIAGQTAEAKQMLQHSSPNATLTDTMSVIQNQGKYLRPEDKDYYSKLGFFQTDYGPKGIKGNLGSALYGGQYAGALHGATDSIGGFARAAAYTGVPVLPSLSLGLGQAMQSRRQRTYAQQRDQLGTSGRVAERMGTLGSARSTAMLAPGAALFGMSHLPGVGGLAGAGAGMWKGAMTGITSGIGKGVLGAGSGMAKLVGAKGVGAGLAGMAGGSIAPLVAGGLALALPSIIGGIAGAKAEQKRRRLRGKREPFFRVEKKYSQSGAIDSLVQRLVSAEAMQPADQLKIELLKMIESHTSPIAKITEIVDYLDQQRDKDVKESTKEYDQQLDKWDAEGEEKDGWKKRIGRGMDRMSLGLQKFNAYNPFQQLATFILEQKTPDQVFKEIRQIQKDRDTADERKAHYKQVASKTGMMLSEVRLMLSPASSLIKMGDSPESKMIILQSAIFDVLRGIARRDVEYKDRLKLQFDSDEEEDKDSAWYEKIPGLAGLSPLFKLAKSGFGFGKDVATKGLGEAVGTRVSTVKDRVKGKYDSLIGNRLKKWSMGEDLYEHMKDPNKLKREMGLIKTGQEKRELFMEKALPGKLDQITTYQGQSVELLRSINNNLGQIVVSMGGAADQPESKVEGMVYDDISGQYLSQRDYDKLIKDREKAYDERVEGMTKTTDKGFFGNIKESAIGGMKGGLFGGGALGITAGTTAAILGGGIGALPLLALAGLGGGGLYGVGKGTVSGITGAAPGDILEMISKFGKRQSEVKEAKGKDLESLRKYDEIQEMRSQARVSDDDLARARRATFGSGDDSAEIKAYEQLQKVREAQDMTDNDLKLLLKETTKYQDRYKQALEDDKEATNTQIKQSRVVRTISDENLSSWKKIQTIVKSIGSDIDDWKLFKEAQSRKDWITGGLKTDKTLEIERDRIARQKAKEYSEKLGLVKRDIFTEEKEKEASKISRPSPFRPTILPTPPPTPPPTSTPDHVPDIIPFRPRRPRQTDDYDLDRASGDFATLPEGGTVKFTQRKQIIVDPGEELHKPNATPGSNLPALPEGRSALTVLHSINKNIGDLVEENKDAKFGGKIGYDVVGGNRNVGMEIEELKAEQEKEEKKKQGKVITDNLSEIIEHLKSGFGTKKGGDPIDKKKGGLFGMLGGLFSSLFGGAGIGGLIAALGGLAPLLASVPVALATIKAFGIKFDKDHMEEGIGKSKIAVKGVRAGLRTAATVIDKGAEATKLGKVAKSAATAAKESKTAAKVATGAGKAAKVVKESAVVGKVVKTADTAVDVVKSSKAGSAVLSGAGKVADLAKAAKATDTGAKVIKGTRAASKVMGTGAKAVGTVAKNVTKKVAVKSLATVGKKLPVVGALIGGGLAAWRYAKGDKVGAAMELASGLAGTIPGPGTAISIGIDAALLAKDLAEARKSGTMTPEMKAEEERKLTELNAISTPEVQKLIGGDLVKFDKLKGDKKILFDKKAGLWRVAETKPKTAGLKQTPTEKSLETEDRPKVAQSAAMGVAVAPKVSEIPKASEQNKGFFSKFKDKVSLKKAALYSIPGVGAAKMAKDFLFGSKAEAAESQVKAPVAPDKTNTPFTPPPVGEVKAEVAPDKTRQETEKKRDIPTKILDAVNRIADILTEGFGMEGTRAGLKKQQKEQELVRKKMTVGVPKPELDLKPKDIQPIETPTIKSTKLKETLTAPPIPTVTKSRDLPTILPGKPGEGKPIRTEVVSSPSKNEKMKDLLRQRSTPKLQKYLKSDLHVDDIKALFATGRIKKGKDDLYDLIDKKAIKPKMPGGPPVAPKIPTVAVKDNVGISEAKGTVQTTPKPGADLVTKLKARWNQFAHGELLNKDEIENMYKPGGKAAEIKKNIKEFEDKYTSERKASKVTENKSLGDDAGTVPISMSSDSSGTTSESGDKPGFFKKVTNIWKKEFFQSDPMKKLVGGAKKFIGAFDVDKAKDMIGLRKDKETSPEVSESPKASSVGKLVTPVKDPAIITSPFGPRKVKGGSSDHKGVDFRGGMGAPAMAVKDGKVALAGGRYGTVAVQHEDGDISRYLHLSKFNVKTGDEVSAGQVIGGIGGKGPKGANQYPPHLHFDIKRRGQFIDPELEFHDSGTDFGYAKDIVPDRQLSAKLSKIPPDFSKLKEETTGMMDQDKSTDVKKKASSSSTMDPSIQDAFKKQVMAHEGVVLHEYKDSLGYPTIGVGHLIKKGEEFPKKITMEQAKELFDKDFQKHLSDASTGLPIWKEIDDVRRGALLDMTFNMGVGGVRGFKNTLAALKRGDYEQTAQGVMDSKYARQVGGRASVNANLLRTGDPSNIVQREPAVYAERGAYFTGDLTSMQQRFFGGKSVPAEIHPNEAIVPLKDKAFQSELTSSLSIAVDRSSGGFGKVTQSLLSIADKLEQVLKRDQKGELKAGKISNEKMQETRQIVSPRKFEDTDTGKALLRQQSQVRIPEYSQVPSVSNSGRQQGSAKIEQLRPINDIGAAVLESIFSNTITNFESSAKQFALGQNPFRILR